MVHSLRSLKSLLRAEHRPEPDSACASVCQCLLRCSGHLVSGRTAALGRVSQHSSDGSPVRFPPLLSQVLLTAAAQATAPQWVFHGTSVVQA